MPNLCNEVPGDRAMTGGPSAFRWRCWPSALWSAWPPRSSSEFAGQYNHATGVRKVTRDTYRVDAKGSAGSSAVWGRFTPTR
ncbi:hypothetical protein F1D05_30110 [Kribbella qitaiheensis]|uniref:Uncharacterized protein n=1 Tax=Kribbella qitaiheensis TaxID=1544730 RepID=A0A7G6X584_9ACTN|nr:hypothetical protein [Kribbella qitaiheensis]QNE21399.1 hypothetical protein F1D05_30110 [Kribbella qitaiheensis]